MSRKVKNCRKEKSLLCSARNSHRISRENSVNLRIFFFCQFKEFVISWKLKTCHRRASILWLELWNMHQQNLIPKDFPESHPKFTKENSLSKKICSEKWKKHENFMDYFFYFTKDFFFRYSYLAYSYWCVGASIHCFPIPSFYSLLNFFVFFFCVFLNYFSYEF